MITKIHHTAVRHVICSGHQRIHGQQAGVGHGIRYRRYRIAARIDTRTGDTLSRCRIAQIVEAMITIARGKLGIRRYIPRSRPATPYGTVFRIDSVAVIIVYLKFISSIP